MNKKQFLEDNKLNFEVRKEAIQVPQFWNEDNDLESDREFKTSPEYFALVRPDTNKVFSIVKRGYEVFSNEDLYDLGVNICNEAGLKLSPIGHSYRGGAMVGLTIPLEEQDPLAKFGVSDRIARSLLIVNSFDMSSAIKIMTLDVRLGCMNQLVYVAKRAGLSFSIRHTKEMRVMVAQAIKAIAKIQKNQEGINDKIRYMFETNLVGVMDVAEIYGHFIEDEMQIEKGSKRYSNMMDRFVAGYEHRTNANIRGNLWGAYNGISYYTDHMARNTKGSDRGYNVLFGQKGSLKNRAFNYFASIS